MDAERVRDRGNRTGPGALHLDDLAVRVSGDRDRLNGVAGEGVGSRVAGLNGSGHEPPYPVSETMQAMFRKQAKSPLSAESGTQNPERKSPRNRAGDSAIEERGILTASNP